MCQTRQSSCRRTEETIVIVGDGKIFAETDFNVLQKSTSRFPFYTQRGDSIFVVQTHATRHISSTRLGKMLEVIKFHNRQDIPRRVVTRRSFSWNVCRMEWFAFAPNPSPRTAWKGFLTFTSFSSQSCRQIQPDTGTSTNKTAKRSDNVCMCCDLPRARLAQCFRDLC